MPGNIILQAKDEVISRDGHLVPGFSPHIYDPLLNGTHSQPPGPIENAPKEQSDPPPQPLNPNHQACGKGLICRRYHRHRQPDLKCPAGAAYDAPPSAIGKKILKYPFSIASLPGNKASVHLLSKNQRALIGAIASGSSRG